MPAPDGDNLIVLEGNRRLAALRILREPDLVERIASSEQLPHHGPASRGTTARDSRSGVGVFRRESREGACLHRLQAHQRPGQVGRLRQGPGSRRSGTRQGDPTRKFDRYCESNRRPARHDQENGVRDLRAEQAEEERLFDIEDRHTGKFNFSHLYTALARSQYMEYLGLGAAWARHDPERTRCPGRSSKRFGRCLSGSYGSKQDVRGRPCGRRIPTSSVSGRCSRMPKGATCSKRRAISTRPTGSTEPVDQQSPLL